MGELLSTLNRLGRRLRRRLSHLAGPVLASPDSYSGSAAEGGSTLLVGGRIELGGPEAPGADAWAGRLFGATGDPREVIGYPHASNLGTELHGGELTPGEGARIGPDRFEGAVSRAAGGSCTMTEINVIVTGTTSRLGPAIAASWVQAAGVR